MKTPELLRRMMALDTQGRDEETMLTLIKLMHRELNCTKHLCDECEFTDTTARHMGTALCLMIQNGLPFDVLLQMAAWARGEPYGWLLIESPKVGGWRASVHARAEDCISVAIGNGDVIVSRLLDLSYVERMMNGDRSSTAAA